MTPKLHPLQTKLLETELYKKFLLNIELIKDTPQDYFEDFQTQLYNHPLYEEIKENYLLDPETNSILRILCKTPLSEITNLTDDEIEFYPICNKAEIARISNPRNLDDMLLILRASEVVFNVRLNKVFFQLRKYYKDKWNFSNFFNSKLFKNYLNSLPDDKSKICKLTSYGLISINEANGVCRKTKFGNVITVSIGLKYFLYYMNLFYYGSGHGVAIEDLHTALMIGVRTMMGKETFDFELDSRGRLPGKLNKHLNFLTNSQLEFVIGHEFAHHYLGHLSDDRLTINAKSDNRSPFEDNSPFYSYRHLDELEADYNSIMAPIISLEKRHELACSGFAFFLYLDIYDTCHNFFNPPKSTFTTHPEPRNRAIELRRKLPVNIGFSKEDLESYFRYNDEIKNNLLKETLPIQTDTFEMYGSIYLPNFKKDKKYDHIDF
ncbi:hypothetical protein ACVW0P_001802 [Mucilaginibacter sp. UYNi724]